VINTAAETHVGNSIVRSDDFIKSNINGVQNLLELLRNYRQEHQHTPRLIHFSTDEVYGDIVSGSHTETDMLKPSNPYSATKASADMLIQAWSRTYNINYTILRPTNNYGIGQYVEKLIPKTCKYINLGKKIPLHNNGTPIRNWLHAQDTASAVETVLMNDTETLNQIYNICGGFEQTNLDTVKQIIFNVFGDVDCNDFIDNTFQRIGQDVRYSLDDTKIRALGWSPKKVFEEELGNIVEYYKQHFVW
jgi:dTDP-glucose 4,6-dehydratase